LLKNQQLTILAPRFRATCTLVNRLSVPIRQNVAVRVPDICRNVPEIFRFVPFIFRLVPQLCRFVPLVFRICSACVPLFKGVFRQISAMFRNVSGGSQRDEELGRKAAFPSATGKRRRVNAPPERGTKMRYGQPGHVPHIKLVARLSSAGAARGRLDMTLTVEEVFWFTIHAGAGETPAQEAAVTRFRER
jgi:hypothetical protein